jgi:peptidoglycan DL-endopeptidase CwlO
VASPRRTQVLRSFTVLALTGAAAVVPVTAAHAEPSCSTARQQFVTNGNAAEKVAEQLNDARVDRVKVAKTVAAADKKARAATQEYGKVAGSFRKIVAGELKSAPAGQVAVFFTSDSPKAFAEQMALMDYVAGRKGKTIQALAGVRATAVKAQAESKKQLAAKTKVEKDIATKVADLKKRATTLTGLMSRLCAQDNPAVQGISGGNVQQMPVGPASGGAAKAVQTALAQIGDPYVWAAAGPNAFDCSGLTSYAYAAAGISLPHSSSGQFGYGTRVSRSEVRAGDLVFFYSPISHVGLAINNTQMVHASTFGVPVRIDNIDSSPFAGATRLG